MSNLVEMSAQHEQIRAHSRSERDLPEDFPPRKGKFEPEAPQPVTGLPLSVLHTQ
jgi:hypothetical protein